jgi:hypothetical protein
VNQHGQALRNPSRPRTSVYTGAGSLFTLVLPQADDLIQHDVVFRRVNIDAEVGNAESLEADKSIRGASWVQRAFLDQIPNTSLNDLCSKI